LFDLAKNSAADKTPTIKLRVDILEIELANREEIMLWLEMRET